MVLLPAQQLNSAQHSTILPASQQQYRPQMQPQQLVALSPTDQPGPQSSCPNCRRPTKPDWRVCPYCITSLSKYDAITRSIYELRSDGFDGFRSIKELSLNRSGVPNKSGIYFVLYVNGNRPKFVERGVGGFFKGKDPNVSVSELESKWVDGAIVIYIGKTEHSLNHRISTLMDFGKGMPVGHYGGRYIWQIADCQDLVLCWKTLPGDIAKQSEMVMVQRFKALHGKIPFANLRE